jgi:hypothetical protein
MFDKEWKTFEFKSWLDIGNVSSLKNSRKKIQDRFKILDKNDESIFLFDEFVIKFFFDRNICNNRVQRGFKLNGLAPKILDSSDNFYKYEFSKGQLFSSVVNESNFEEFLNWSMMNLWIEKPISDDFKKICYEFYFEKTIKRVNKFLKENNIEDRPDIINGLSVPSISEMISNIDNEYLCDGKPYQFHGDYILDNIIKIEDGFSLIDWRQDFGGDLNNGDIYYDLAKLNHNLIFNHDIVNNGHFSVKKNNEQIVCDILRSDNLTNCREILHNFVLKNKLNVEKLNILTSIIWLNMSPLHDVKIGNFLYYFGKLNLYLAIQERP